MIKSAYFLDWCPVSIPQSFRGRSHKTQNIFPELYKDIKWAGDTIVQQVLLRSRDDGIFLFFIKFKNEVPVREAITSARHVSMNLKEKILDHIHVFHDSRDHPPHNPVLIEDPNSDEFIDNLKTGFHVTKQNNLPVDANMEFVLGNEQCLLTIRALDRQGNVSEKPAALVLRHLHSRKREELTASWTIGYLDWNNNAREKRRRALILTSALTLALAIYSLYAKDFTSTAWKSATITIILGICFFRVLILFWITKRLHLPRRKIIWSHIGYLSICEIYSELLNDLALRYKIAVASAQLSFMLNYDCMPRNAYRGALASLNAMINSDTDEMNASFQEAIAFLTALGAIAAAIAIAWP